MMQCAGNLKPEGCPCTSTQTNLSALCQNPFTQQGKHAGEASTHKHVQALNPIDNPEQPRTQPLAGQGACKGKVLEGGLSLHI
eukprot:1143247-Pelagomonas_calceolata.AAC.14